MTGRTHRIAPVKGTAAFTQTTHDVLDWLAGQRLHLSYGDHRSYPPTMDVKFGAGSGWLWGKLTISCETGRLKHLAVSWADADGTHQFEAVSGPTAIRAALERHGEQRVERITWLAQWHGLIVTVPQPTVPGGTAAR